MHAERPNELLHWDYVYMGPSNKGYEYILVFKDDASNFVWLYPCKSADTTNTYEGLLSWFSTFGICYTWDTDQGTHFKNDVIATLKHNLGAHHHFTTARSPWANGTVEVVNRELLRLFRSLISEWKMDRKDWPKLIKLVQLALNQTRSAALENEAPVTVMTGIAAMSPLSTIVKPGLLNTDVITLEELLNIRKKNRLDTRIAIDRMHKHVAIASNRQRKKGRKDKEQFKMPQFAIGDFVLYAGHVHT